VRKMSGGKWKIVARSPRVTVADIAHLPLPAQMICEAAIHFARAALNGREVYVHYDESSERPFVTVSVGEERFAVEYNGAQLLIFFENEKRVSENAFRYRKREIAIECDAETAKTIVSGTVTMLFVAVREGIVQLNPKLESVFFSPPPQ